MLGNFRGKRMAVTPDNLAFWLHVREKPVGRGGPGRRVAR